VRAGATLRPAAALALACAVLSGCATGIPVEALPEAPFAFVHRTLAQGRERADQIASRQGEDRTPTGGVMDLNSVDELLDGLRGGRRPLSQALRGRLALYHPRTGEIEIVESFGWGTVPLDWSADRTRLLVASRRRGDEPRLYQYSTERRDVAPALRSRDSQLAGAFGPDRRIAYVVGERRERGLATSVWATEQRRAEPRQLTPGPGDSLVRWSPDGRTLLFQSWGPRRRPVIKVLDMEDPLAEPRTVARGREPAFTPQGDWVVYSREVDDEWNLWRMRPDGTGKTALGFRPQGEADERHPTVSPDGRWVVYVAESEHRQRIRIRGMDGSGDRLLIEDADGTLPVW